MMESSNQQAPDRTVSNQDGVCVPQLVQRQALMMPDAVAIRAASGSLTYRELEVRANRMARYLQSLGVASGSIVGLCLDRSLDFPIAALGVLKAGAAYLPLEPRSPGRRLEGMLDAAQVSVVLTNSGAGDSLSGDARRVVCLERCAGAINNCSSESLDIHVNTRQTAYVIFTSGSTGVPKAVAVGHDSLLNLIEWHKRTFQVTAADRATQLASIGFDAAVWELWPYLVAGASVHLVDEETRTDPDKLRTFLIADRITISFVPTPLAEQMLKLSWPKNTALRFLLTGADTLHYYPPADLPFSLINNYGPTESTVVATSGIIRPQESANQLPAIGRPIDNIDIYILDHNMQRVPTGTMGEIYVGGRGLAQGYLNDPALTAQRFVKNPFSTAVDAKLYRTGDMGCYRADGQIAFHGRADDQVKINGFRVELNEVASALRRHSAVRESIVSTRENEAGEKQLVAYVVPFGILPTVSELRDFLAKELPEYMLPAMFVGLKSLPVASSGKVDRLALPVPSHENILRDEAFQMPSSATEQRVGKIVASLLGLEHVGVNDNFFYLGGNSLFGTQLIARLRDAFQVEVPLLKLFDHPTVAELAGEVESMIVAKLESMSEEEAQRLLATQSSL